MKDYLMIMTSAKPRRLSPCTDSLELLAASQSSPEFFKYWLQPFC